MRIFEPLDRLAERDRTVAIGARDGEKTCFGACSGMLVDRRRRDDPETLGGKCLEPDLERAARDRAGDFGLEQRFEAFEDAVLHRNGECEQPVEEGCDRRELVLQATARVGQGKPGLALERAQRAAVEFPGMDHPVKLPQRVARVLAFEIVACAKHALAAGFALTAGDRAERVEAPCNRREEALLGLHVGGDRSKQRRLRLVRAIGAPESLDCGVSLPTGFEQVVDAQPPVPRAEVGMVAAARPARVGKHQHALVVVHEGLGLGEVGVGGTGLELKTIGFADNAARTACHLRDRVGAEALDDLIERSLDRIERGEPLDHPVAPSHGLAADHRLAIDDHRARAQVARGIGERLEQLDRKAVGQIVQHVFARRDVDAQVVPLGGVDFGEPTFHQCFAGRDDLDDAGMTCGQISFDAGDQRRRLHRGDQVVEEALLGTFEGRARDRPGLGVERTLAPGDIGRLQRGVEVVVNDLKGRGIGVVDPGLLGGQFVLKDFVFDAFVRQRSRRVESERLEIASEHFHRRNAAALDRRDEVGARREREILTAPQPEALRVGEVLHPGGTGCGHVDDARIGERMLEPQPGAALLRRRRIAALAGAARGVLHGVALVEHDHSVEVATQPFDDLLDARKLARAPFAPQRSVGCKQDAFSKPDRCALREARERSDQQPFLPERRPVASRVLDQLVGLGDPQRAAPSLVPVVENDPGDLASLASAGAVTEEPSPAEPHRVVGSVGRGLDPVAGRIDRPGTRQMAGVRFARINHALDLRTRQHAFGEVMGQDVRPITGPGRRDRGHRGGLDEFGRMVGRAGDAQRLEAIVLVERVGHPGRGIAFPVDGLVGEFDGFDLDARRGCWQSPVESERGRPGHGIGRRRGPRDPQPVRHTVDHMGQQRRKIARHRRFGRVGGRMVGGLLVDHREPHVDAGAVRGKHAAVNPERQGDPRVLLDPVEGLAPAWMVGMKVCAGNRDQSAPWRKPGQRRADMAHRRIGCAPVDMRHRRERRVHQDHARDHVRGE